MCQMHIILTVCVICILFFEYVSTAYYFDNMCQLHIKCILFWQYVSTANNFDSMCQLHIILSTCVDCIWFCQHAHIILTVCVNCKVFWQLSQLNNIFTTGFKCILVLQYASNAYYFYSMYPLQIILTVCVNCILFWYVSIAYYFDSMCRLQTILICADCILFWQYV
jgi:hypothetical protein